MYGWGLIPAAFNAGHPAVCAVIRAALGKGFHERYR